MGGDNNNDINNASGDNDDGQEEKGCRIITMRAIILTTEKDN